MVKRLNKEDRLEIEAMYINGFALKDIAKKFKRHPVTIHRILGNLDKRIKKKPPAMENHDINLLDLRKKLEELKFIIDDVIRICKKDVPESKRYEKDSQKMLRDEAIFNVIVKKLGDKNE